MKQRKNGQELTGNSIYFKEDDYMSMKKVLINAADISGLHFVIPVSKKKRKYY
jgi:hypothetical protein